MTDLTGLRLAVAGAGVFGLCTALRAAHAGAVVELWDPGPLGDNASGVAAGMIAPMGEALFDPVSPPHVPLFRAGREGWRQMERLAPDLAIDRSGAIVLFDGEAALSAARVRLAMIGAEATLIDADAIHTCCGVKDGRYGLLTLEDWRIDPPSALAHLRSAVLRAGGTLRMQAFPAASLADFDAVVLAAGMDSQVFTDQAPELSVLAPIKGQLVRFHGGADQGPTIRTPDLYLVPQAGGLVAGGSMEAGRTDRQVDPAIVSALRGRALALMPDLEGLPFEGRAGVRAATPDGLPLGGPSSRPGLFLATGARRNGWLLAPLVSQILVSYLSGQDGGPFAATLDPRRFSRA